MLIIKKIYYALFDLIQTLVIAGAIFVVIYAFLFRPYQVNGLSMFPNFDNGEYVLTNLIIMRIGTLERGDVIVFNSPINKEKDFIKRIIASPGDTISVKEGSVYLNGAKLNERFLPTNVKTRGGSFLDDGGQVIVPDDQYFVMGDNRDFSSDSREWGLVSQSEIIGKSFVVYWPPNNFRTVKHIQNN